VNTTAQYNLFREHIFTDPIPMFPFNTDGIDPSGGNMHIYNLTVQNFDDVVVPKPSHDDDCTRDMLVENVEVRLGVGMSIGSVPPHVGGSCIRNITFRNVVMKRPFKGIYVKTNPGSNGWGNISDIYYKNISMDRPIWWAIYLGPQQMR
jgi:polygalacturonase